MEPGSRQTERGSLARDVYDARAREYEQFGNGHVADAARRLLPEGGSLVDAGCASGGLIALLRGRAALAVGIEVSPVAAAQAEEVADRVVCAPIEEADLPAASFDLLVGADVLEHLADPLTALRRALEWVKPGGAVIVSVPNVAHWRARLTLLRGKWPQDPSGTFDSSHLRWYTADLLAGLLRDAGVVAVSIEPVVPRLRNHVPALTRVARAERVAERGWQALGARWPGLMGYQLVATGRRPAT